MKGGFGVRDLRTPRCLASPVLSLCLHLTLSVIPPAICQAQAQGQAQAPWRRWERGRGSALWLHSLALRCRSTLSLCAVAALSRAGA